MRPPSPPAPDREAERIARESYGKLVALLTAEFRDVAAAEDAVSDALLTALARWPTQGVPESPEGWLVTVARRRLLDETRRTKSRASQTADLVNTLPASTLPEAFTIPDRRLALLFVCSHPAIDPAARAPLILQTALGFDASRIAQAFLVSPTSMAQRLVRAKRKIKDAGIRFDIPGSTELAERLDAVLDAIYACYTDGWATPLDADDERHGLAEEAIWLARLLVELCPNEPETIGLLALLLYAEARAAARRTSGGDYVPLSEQDPALWNDKWLGEAEELLWKASSHRKIGRFQVEAAIQSAHVARRKTGRTDWAAILSLYEALLIFARSPVVIINRSVAIAEVRGPAEALQELDGLADEPRIRDYQPYWAAKANFYQRLGDIPNAKLAYTRAAGLSTDNAVRKFLILRRDALPGGVL